MLCQQRRSKVDGKYEEEFGGGPSRSRRRIVRMRMRN